MSKNTYNIVLTNLSIVNGDIAKKILDKERDPNMYIYDIDGLKGDFEGIVTNEAGIKYVVDELKGNNDYIDEIYYVASEAIVSKVKGLEDDTHESFFVKQMSIYLQENNINVPTFTKHLHNITNNPKSKELINISIDIVSYLLDLKLRYKDKKVNLYIESNGGFREFILIVVSVLRTLRDSDINIKRIVGVNFYNGIGEIVDKSVAYKVIDLYSGIDEFINYGRSLKIEEYFNNSDIELTVEMEEVLNAIIDMSDAFCLCRPSQMMEMTLNLKKAIEKYNLTKSSKLFDYLVNKIESEYNSIFIYFHNNSTINYNVLRAMLLFCLKHNLIQQAITLYSEYMPIIFYDENIISYSNKSLIKDHFNTYISNKKPIPKGDSIKFTFIQQYMLVRRDGLLGLYERLNYDYVKASTIKEKCNAFRILINNNYVSIKYDKEQTIAVLENYLSIKDARNISNHASKKKNKNIDMNFKNVNDSIVYIKKSIVRLDKLILKSKIK